MALMVSSAHDRRRRRTRRTSIRKADSLIEEHPANYRIEPAFAYVTCGHRRGTNVRSCYRPGRRRRSTLIPRTDTDMADTPATRTRTQARRQTAATNRSTAAKKAAATRARNRAAEAAKRSAAATQAAQTRREAAKGPVERYADLAGRAVAIPVGAALVARDNVVAGVSRYSSRATLEHELRARRQRVETELRRFERRGHSAGARVQRDLEALRGNVIASRRDAGAQVGHLVQTGITAGTQVAARVTERVARGA